MTSTAESEDWREGLCESCASPHRGQTQGQGDTAPEPGGAAQAPVHSGPALNVM